MAGRWPHAASATSASAVNKRWTDTVCIGGRPRGACYTSRASGGGRMRIKSPKDFWSGLMFIASGLFFLLWAIIHYQMGTAVRMGPAYFPTLLGGLLAFLGVIILAESLMLRTEGAAAQLKLPFNI